MKFPLSIIVCAICLSNCSMVDINSSSNLKENEGYVKPMVVFINYKANSYNLYNSKIGNYFAKKTLRKDLMLSTYHTDLISTDQRSLKYGLNDTEWQKILDKADKDYNDLIIVFKPQGVSSFQYGLYNMTSSSTVHGISYFVNAIDIEADSSVWRGTITGSGLSISEGLIKKIGRKSYKKMKKEHLLMVN